MLDSPNATGFHRAKPPNNVLARGQTLDRYAKRRKIFSLPNHDYIASQDITLPTILAALDAAGISADIRDVFYSGASSEEVAAGYERVAVQCVVAGFVPQTAPQPEQQSHAIAVAAEATLRASITAVLAALAP